MKFCVKQLYLNVMLVENLDKLIKNLPKGVPLPLPKILKSSFIIRIWLNLVWNTFNKHHHDSLTTA